jgi:hypothetical protein
MAWLLGFMAGQDQGYGTPGHTFQRAVEAYLEDLDASIALMITTARTKRDNKAVVDRPLSAALFQNQGHRRNQAGAC